MNRFTPLTGHLGDAGDKVELEKGEVGQVLPGEKLAAKMRVDEAHPPEPGAAGALVLKRGDLDAMVVPDDNIFDHPPPVDDKAGLA